MTFRSFVTLGYYFVRQLLRRGLAWRYGLELFRKNYWSEGLLPIAPDDGPVLRAASRCIACGLCDVHFSAWPQVDRSTFGSPSDLPRALSRSMPEARHFEGYLNELEKGDLSQLEAVCPVGVPFVALVAVTRRHAALTNSSDGSSHGV